MAKAANLLTNIEQLCNAGLRHFRVRTGADADFHASAQAAIRGFASLI